MGYATAEERARYARLSVAFGRGAAALKRSAKFGKSDRSSLADGSLALDRVEAASIRFPALEDVRLICIVLSATAKASQTRAARRSSPSCARLRL